MKSKLTKLMAVIMAVAIVFSLAACGKNNGGDTTTEASDVAANGTTATDATGTSDTTLTGTSDVTATSGTNAQGETTTKKGESTTVANTKIPTTKAEILSAYTAIMNKGKTDKPAFKKYEYQVLPENERKIGGAVKYLLPIANSFMNSEEKAKSEPSNYDKNGDMHGFPVKNASKGCMITDPNAIKTAKCEKLSNGNYRITIVLNDELNPEPYKAGQTKAASNTGNMFCPLGKSDIDNELKNNKTVKRVVKSANYSLQYRNCRSVLEYNPKNSQIVSVDQYTNTLITMTGKIIILGTSSGTAVLEMYYKAYNFKY